MRALGQTLDDAYRALLKTTKAGIAPNAANKALAQYWCKHVQNAGDARCQYPQHADVPLFMLRQNESRVVKFARELALFAVVFGAVACMLWQRWKQRQSASPLLRRKHPEYRT